MNLTDPIADMLTRIRNANRMKHQEVFVPVSRTKKEILAPLHAFISKEDLPPADKNMKLFIRK